MCNRGEVVTLGLLMLFWRSRAVCCQDLGINGILVFIVVWCSSEQQVTSNSCCFSGSCGTLSLLGFWFTHSISVQWDLWPFLSLLISSSTGFTEDAPHLQGWQKVESGGGFTLPGGQGTTHQLSCHLANLLRFATKPTYCFHKGSLEITNGLLHPALKGVWAHRHKGCLTSKGSITHVIKSLLSEQGTEPENLFSNAEISALAQQYNRYKNTAIITTSGWENWNKSFESTVVFTNSPELSRSWTFLKLLWILKLI